MKHDTTLHTIQTSTTMLMLKFLSKHIQRSPNVYAITALNYIALQMIHF